MYSEPYIDPSNLYTKNGDCRRQGGRESREEKGWERSSGVPKIYSSPGKGAFM